MTDSWSAIDRNERGSLTAVSSADDKTIVRLVADPITGALLVSSSGAGGIVFYTPTGLVNASNNVFGVTADPTSVISDGVTYFEGHGYSYSALSITLDIPPSEYIRYTL